MPSFEGEYSLWNLVVFSHGLGYFLYQSHHSWTKAFADKKAIPNIDDLTVLLEGYQQITIRHLESEYIPD